jgi:DNA-binding FadR family transcriptional regulator
MPDRAELSRVPRISRADEVRRQLEAAIARGDYPPGSRLPSERDLVGSFGVSRLSVREGIKGLIGMGLVEARHGRGYYVVATPSETFRNAFGTWLDVHSSELIDLYQVRGALTTLAAQHAMRSDDPTAIQRIVDAHAAFLNAVEANASPQQIALLDVGFHRAIAEASGSQLIESLLNDLFDGLEEPRHMIMSLSGHPERSAREHDAIVTAIQAGDPDEVARTVDRHIMSVCKTIQEYATAV